MSDVRCKKVEGENILPGWGCCQCRIYNDVQREACKNCHHIRCEVRDLEHGEETCGVRYEGKSHPEFLGQICTRGAGHTTRNPLSPHLSCDVMWWDAKQKREM